MQFWRSIGSCAALALASAIAPSSAFAQQQEAAQEEPDYAAMAREDIEGAYAIFAEHHPGMYNPLDPEFGERLAAARDEALAFAENAVDPEGHLRAVRTLSNALADGHAAASIAYNGTGSVWTGFSTVWRGDALYVSSESDAGPPIGSALVSCDGIGAEELIREHAFGMIGRPGEAGQWWIYADNLFDRVPSLYVGLPENCIFRTPTGESQAFELEWRPVTQEEWESRFDNPDRLPVGLTEPRERMFLFSMPTFSPGERDHAGYHAMFSDIDARIGELADARALILDLRWNNGGSATWSQILAEHLWGQEALAEAQAQYFQDTEVWYLADEGNIAHFTELVGVIRERGNDLIADFAEETAASLSAARDEGELFLKQPVLDDDERTAPQVAPRSLPPVYVITDGRCASACLDAVDTFTRFDGVRLIGAPTSADTEYLEIRRERLPSGRGWVVLPTKIWVNRPRGSGEVYHPDILVTHLEWTTVVFLDHIERDLAAD